MKKIALLLLSLSFLWACGGSEPEPMTVQAIPDNKADIDPSTIASVEIAPGLSGKTLLEGDGPVAEIGHTAIVHYTGWLLSLIHI